MIGSWMDISAETANKFYKGGWIVSVGGAALTLIGIFFLWWGTRVRDREADLQFSNLTGRASAAERKAAPRSVSEAQLKNMAASLEPFNGTAVDVLVCGSTLEISAISTRLTQALGVAHWHVRTWQVISGMSANDISILTKSDFAMAVGTPARDLLEALGKNGLFAMLVPPVSEKLMNWEAVPANISGPDWDPTRVAPIRMIIGSKTQ